MNDKEMTSNTGPPHKKGTPLTRMNIGQEYRESFRITAELISAFARVTREHNPIHLDEEYAKKTVFRTRVAQGMLLGGLLSGVLGTRFPGVGTIYLSQNLTFLRPAFIGDEITLCLTVREMLLEKNRLRLESEFVNQRGERVVRGETWVMPPLK